MAADFSLWPCVDNTGQLANGLGTPSCMPCTTNKGGLFNSMDLFSSDQRSLVDDLDQSLSNCDQILPLLNGSQSPSAELLQLLQQQQQLDDEELSLLEEQRIDAQIERLLQLKAQMQAVKQVQQPVILEEAPIQTPFASMGSSSGATALSPTVALDSSFLSPSATIDISQDWSWLAGANNTTGTAIAPPFKPARHSIDLGGLALRMSACDLSANTSFTLQTSVVNQNPLVNNGFTLQPAENPALAAALSPQFAAPAPLMSSGVAAASAAPAVSPAMSPAVPVANNIHLQSALFMPTQLPGFSAPGLDVQSTAALRVMASQPPAARTRPANTRRMSLDSYSRLPAYNSPAAAGMQAYSPMNSTAVLPTYAGGPRGGGHKSFAANDGSARRASIDLPLSATTQSRCPPKRSPSMLNASSACNSGRNSPLYMRQQQQQQQGGVCGDAPAQAVRAPSCRSTVHQAPKWAGAHWNPMADVVKNGQQAAKGTGVFIPGGGLAEPAEVVTKAS